METIGQQYLELSWRDAWRHELRGPHGEWVRSEAAMTDLADIPEIGSRITNTRNGRTGKIISRNAPIGGKVYAVQVQYDNDGKSPRTQSIETRKLAQGGEAAHGSLFQRLSSMSDKLLGPDPAAVKDHIQSLRDTAQKSYDYDGLTNLTAAADAYSRGDTRRAAASMVLAANGMNAKGTPLAREYMSIARQIEPGITDSNAEEAEAATKVLKRTARSVPKMLGGGHLDWDGQTATVYPQDSRPGTLAEIDWDGHMNLSDEVAAEIQADEQHPDEPVGAPGAYTVLLHELIHADVPAGENRATDDKRAYRSDFAHADIEEGFTQLGAAQHAREYFDAAGVGGRHALDNGSLKEQHHLADINGQPFNPDMSASMTMDEWATDLAEPAKIRSGNSWGVYRDLTAKALDWVSLIAQQHTGKPESDPATRAEMNRMADEVNRVGTAAKPKVMASHVIADMNLPEPVKDQVLAKTTETILNSWGDDIAATVSQARQIARQEAQRAQAALERAAA
jgi:hypothetical protein